MPVPLGPQNYDAVVGMREKLIIDEMRRQEMMRRMIDPLSEGNVYDDTATPGQMQRDAQQRDMDRFTQRHRAIVPEQYDKPTSYSPFRNLPMPLGTEVGPLGRAYDSLPEPLPPRYPTPDYGPDQPFFKPMEQLMQFYSGEE